MSQAIKAAENYGEMFEPPMSAVKPLKNRSRLERDWSKAA